jgi:transposase
MTIKRAAEIVGVGPSTARMIFKKYQRSGTIFEPKTSKKQQSE